MFRDATIFCGSKRIHLRNLSKSVSRITFQSIYCSNISVTVHFNLLEMRHRYLIYRSHPGRNLVHFHMSSMYWYTNMYQAIYEHWSIGKSTIFRLKGNCWFSNLSELQLAVFLPKFYLQLQLFELIEMGFIHCNIILQ